MKRLGLAFALMMGCLFSQAQVYVDEVYTLVDDLDLSTISGADTTIYASVIGSGDWSIDMVYTSVTGSGTCAVLCGHTKSNMHAYNTSPSATVTSTSSYQFEDDRFAWKFIAVKITVGTISAGTLNVTVLRR